MALLYVDVANVSMVANDVDAGVVTDVVVITPEVLIVTVVFEVNVDEIISEEDDTIPVNWPPDFGKALFAVENAELAYEPAD